MQLTSRRSLLAPLALLPLLAGCLGGGPPREHPLGERPFRAQKAVCVLRGTQGHEGVEGTITLTRVEGGVLVEGEVRGLAPGLHGFHVHEWGEIACADGMCTGGHFDPTGSPHGRPEDAERHVGDLGNLEAGPDGRARYRRLDTRLSLDFASPACVIGRAIIVHEKADDFGQPVGNAGGRVAFGVIGIAKP